MRTQTILCPSCKDDHSEYDDNPDGSLTCLRCGLVFRPEQQQDVIVDRMIERTNGLRSLIVTFQDGRDITLTFPKEMEGEEPVRFRSRLLTQMEKLLYCGFRHVFSEQGIKSVQFDDEIGEG